MLSEFWRLSIAAQRSLPPAVLGDFGRLDSRRGVFRFFFCVPHGVLAHHFVPLGHAGEDKAACPRPRAQRLQGLQRLPGERHEVRGAHLHALGRDLRLRGVDVNFGPLRTPQLARTKHG